MMDKEEYTIAVESIKSWCLTMGKALYPDAKELLITTDAGGSSCQGYKREFYDPA